MDLTFQSIGTIHTPYFAFNAPHQPIPDAPGDFWITLKPDYVDALKALDSFNYIYVLYQFDQAVPPVKLLTTSPWAPETEIGLFASRSPKRPNPIGLSIVQLKEIQGNELIISGIDAYNGTPLLDIKPYMHFLDSKEDANNGWFDALPDKEHTMAHALGLSHEHEHKHKHEHPHHEHPRHHSHHDRTTSYEDGHDCHHHAPEHTHDNNNHDHDHNHDHNHNHSVHDHKLEPKHHHEHND
jgi:tRNA-Thr(GGU) m(6)t(6)A37 methyltransferase TsaA